MARDSVRGLRGALARIAQIPRRAEMLRAEALNQWAEDLQKTAKELAPVRTGALREAIETRVNTSSGKAWVQIKPGHVRDYAYYVEKGTSKMREQPFMGPAAQINRRAGERALQRAAPRFFGRW